MLYSARLFSTQRLAAMKSHIFLLMLLFCYGGLSQRTIHVNASATGNNNGLSWLNAYTDLQLALEDANPRDEIWVAQGTYIPTKDPDYLVSNNNPRKRTFMLLDSVGIYGGFAGNETSRNQRDWKVNQTILSGEIGDSIITSDNCYHVVYSKFASLSQQTVLDGFTITKGYGTWIPAWLPAIEIAENQRGGGICVFGLGSAVFLNLNIINNTGGFGGGVSFSQSNNILPLTPKKYQMINCNISHNNYTAVGGGVHVDHNQATFINCLVSNNTPIGAGNDYGGGLAMFSSAVRMFSCTISQNNAGTDKGMRIWSEVLFEAFNSIISDVSDVRTARTNPSNVRYKNCNLVGSGGSSNWQIGLKATDLGGNIDNVPIYKGLSDLRLDFYSPDRDMGNRNLLPYDSLDIDADGIFNEVLPFDLGSNKRIFGTEIDMGAYEYQASVADTVFLMLCEGDTLNIGGKLVDTTGIYPRLVNSGFTEDSVEYIVVTYDSINVTLEKGLYGAEFSSSQSSANYQWIYCDSSLTGIGDTLQNFVPSMNGSYAVIITNKIGCSDTSECVTINNVGLREQLNEAELHLYPNPATNKIWFTSSLLAQVNSIQIYSTSGQLIMQYEKKQAEDEMIELDLEGIPSGFYVLTINGASVKFVKGMD